MELTKVSEVYLAPVNDRVPVGMAARTELAHIAILEGVAASATIRANPGVVDPARVRIADWAGSFVAHRSTLSILTREPSANPCWQSREYLVPIVSYLGANVSKTALPVLPELLLS
jgi:hypothetical protein